MTKNVVAKNIGGECLRRCIGPGGGDFVVERDFVDDDARLGRFELLQRALALLARVHAGLQVFEARRIEGGRQIVRQREIGIDEDSLSRRYVGLNVRDQVVSRDGSNGAAPRNRPRLWYTLMKISWQISSSSWSLRA